MKQRHWIEYSQEDRRKYDIRSQALRNQRDRQVEMLNQRGRVEIKPVAFKPSVSPTPAVKNALKTEELRPLSAFTVPLSMQVAGMVFSKQQ